LPDLIYTNTNEINCASLVKLSLYSVYRLSFLYPGGASGLGEAVVRHLVEHKANAVIFDLNESGIELAKSLGSQVLFVKVNVCDESMFVCHRKRYMHCIDLTSSLLLI
jgi:hypothetical protein